MLVRLAHILLQLVGELNEFLRVLFHFLETLFVRLLLLVPLKLSARLVLNRIFRGRARQLYAPGRNGRRWRSVTKFVEAQGQPARHGDAENKDSVEDEARRKFERDQQKKANEERFQKVKEDTEKLVQLSNELKDYVGKANEHTLSLDVIKKAEEIERLAKSVKDKMRAN